MNQIHLISLNIEQENKLKELRNKGAGLKELFLLGMVTYENDWATNQPKGDNSNGTKVI